MGMNSRRGYILPLVMIFSIITEITTIAFYQSIFFLGKETIIQEAQYIKGYYYDIAGLRYAAILLKAPMTAPVSFTDAIFNGETRTLIAAPDSTTGPAAPPDSVYLPTTGFVADIGIAAPRALTITITESGTQAAPDPNGTYTVSASYT